MTNNKKRGLSGLTIGILIAAALFLVFSVMILLTDSSLDPSKLPTPRPTATPTLTPTPFLSWEEQGFTFPYTCEDVRQMGMSEDEAGMWPHLDEDGDLKACYGT